MSKIKEVRELSVEVQTTRDIKTQLSTIIEMLVVISKDTKYEYDVTNAIEIYNQKAEWANSTGANNYQVFR